MFKCKVFLLNWKVFLPINTAERVLSIIEKLARRFARCFLNVLKKRFHFFSRAIVGFSTMPLGTLKPTTGVCDFVYKKERSSLIVGIEQDCIT